MVNVPVERWTPERRRELTRTALVDAAAEVFARRGFHGASLDEIAETAGFTRGAIYKNFGSKEELFYAVGDRWNDITLEAFDAQLSGGSEDMFDVPKLAAMWRDTMWGSDADFFALELEFTLYAIRNPEVRERFVAQRRKNLARIARFIDDHAEAAGVSLKVPADTLARILLDASDGMRMAVQIDPAEGNLYEKFLEMLLPAIFAEE